MVLTQTGRLFAGLIAISALGAQAVQTILDLQDGMGLFQSLWRQARYFTVLMVVTTGVTYAVMLVQDRDRSAAWLAALTSWIVMVGLVYHALLASDHSPTGIRAIINVIQHTAVPLAALFYWVAFAPKSGLTFAHPAIWVICPLGYAAFALVRGLFDDTFPYFFLNPETTGWFGVLAYLIGLGALFYVAGALLVIAAKRLDR